MLPRIKFEIEPLVNEMLDQLPKSVWSSKTTTFFDPAIGGGQFVKEIERRLLLAGHSKENIATRVFGFEELSHRLDYAVNKHKLIGQYKVANFLEQGFKMKFNVIVGNPPFQHNSSSKGNKLWPKFICKAVDLLEEDGHLAMITPAGWSAGGNNAPGNIGIIKDVFAKNQVKIANLNNVARYFPKIGMIFSWFVLQKSPVTAPTNVVTSAGDFDVDFRKVNFLPTDVTPLTLSLYNKLFTSFDPFDIVSFDRQEHKHKSDTATKEYTIKHWRLGTDDTVQYVYLKENKTPAFSEKRKVLFPLRRFSNLPMVHVDDVGIPVCQQGFYLDIVDYKVENVRSVWESNLYRFMTYSMHSTGFLKTNIVKSIPAVDLSVKWTNESLYKHFKLTNQEIEYIENAVA